MNNERKVSIREIAGRMTGVVLAAGAGVVAVESITQAASEDGGVSRGAAVAFASQQEPLVQVSNIRKDNLNFLAQNGIEISMPTQFELTSHITPTVTTTPTPTTAAPTPTATKTPTPTPTPQTCRVGVLGVEGVPGSTMFAFSGDHRDTYGRARVGQNKQAIISNIEALCTTDRRLWVEVRTSVDPTRFRGGYVTDGHASRVNLAEITGVTATATASPTKAASPTGTPDIAASVTAGIQAYRNQEAAKVAAVGTAVEGANARSQAEIDFLRRQLEAQRGAQPKPQASLVAGQEPKADASPQPGGTRGDAEGGDNEGRVMGLVRQPLFIWAAGTTIADVISNLVNPRASLLRWPLNAFALIGERTIRGALFFLFGRRKIAWVK